MPDSDSNGALAQNAELKISAADGFASDDRTDAESKTDKLEIDLLPDLDKAREVCQKHLDSSKDDAEKELLRKQLAKIDARIKKRNNRAIIEADVEHASREILVEDSRVSIGPPTLTRFEKARIMGARALQLSLGAPTFIPIPATAKTSLDIAMVELELKAIPIIIRRSLPNGDFQNIPIACFK